MSNTNKIFRKYLVMFMSPNLYPFKMRGYLRKTYFQYINYNLDIFLIFLNLRYCASRRARKYAHFDRFLLHTIPGIS